MQKIGLRQSLSQKLSPQQIQFIKLLQVPTAELEMRVEKELEENPALEEGKESEDEFQEQTDEFGEEKQQDEPELPEGIDIQEYIRDDDVAGYKMQGDGPGFDDERETIVVETSNLNDSLITQLGYLNLDEKRLAIGLQIIGSIDEDGYMRRPLESIVNDLVFTQNIIVQDADVKVVLEMVQQFDPAGIAAQDLQQCLVLQLERLSSSYVPNQIALQIIEDCYEEFLKKHYEKIQRRLNIDNYQDLKSAIVVITHLNPKPGESSDSNSGGAPYIIPDFTVVEQNGKLQITLNGQNWPEIKVSRSYNQMLKDLAQKKQPNSADRETAKFVKQKVESARWFIDALKQRQQTLIGTMEAIVALQEPFFINGDEAKLRPMILKDVADIVQMDISTVSRVVNSKFVQTEFGVFPLKFFFSEGIHQEGGEDVSSREVKMALKEMIEAESKQLPLSDEKLEELLAERGFAIARRTVAKYRELMNIPVARLRKEV